MSHSQILTSPPDRDSLWNTVVEISFWTTVWFGIFAFIKFTVRAPVTIVEEKDPQQKSKRYTEYLNYLLSLFHAVFLIAGSAYCLLFYPAIRNRPYTDFEMFITKVG